MITLLESLSFSKNIQKKICQLSIIVFNSLNLQK